MSILNESQYIALFVVNGSIKKLLSIDCVNMTFWKPRDRHVGISIDIDVGIGIAKNLFCFAKPLFLLSEILYEENIHGEVLFK